MMLPGISGSHPALQSLEAHQQSFGRAYNLSKAGGDGLLDALAVVSGGQGMCAM